MLGVKEKEMMLALKKLLEQQTSSNGVNHCEAIVRQDDGQASLFKIRNVAALFDGIFRKSTRGYSYAEDKIKVIPQRSVDSGLSGLPKKPVRQIFKITKVARKSQ